MSKSIGLNMGDVMHELIDLIKIIETKKKDYNLTELNKLEINLNNNTSLKEKSILYNEIRKDNYCFKLFVIEKSIPIKDKKSNNKLDYSFKISYFLNVLINDDYNSCIITIESSKDLMIIKDSYNYYLNLINNSPIDDIFNELIKSIK